MIRDFLNVSEILYFGGKVPPKKEERMFIWVSIGIFTITLSGVIVSCVLAAKNHKELWYWIGEFLALAGGIGNIIFLCNQDIYQVWHALVGTAFVVLPQLVVAVQYDNAHRRGELWILSICSTLILLFVGLGFLSGTVLDNIDAAFVEQQPEVVECKYYELVANSYGTDNDGNMISSYYLRIEDERCKDEIIKFYYLTDGELRVRILKASEVSICPIDVGEMPFVKFVTINKIRVNSETGEVKEETIMKYELHIPTNMDD